MRRPFVSVAVPYVAGLLLGSVADPPTILALAVLLGMALAALVAWRLRPVLVPALLLIAGWTNLTLHRNIISPLDLRLVTPEDPGWVTLRGRLITTPEERISKSAGREHIRSVSRIAVSLLQDSRGWQPCTGEILVTTPGPSPPGYWRGTTVEVPGLLERPPPPLVDGLFDYRTYLERRGIHRQLKVDSTNDWRCLQRPPTPPWPDQFQAWARRVLALGLPVEDEPLKLQWAMVLGWRTGLTAEVSTPFMQSGTMHIFAISGLHVALIAYILVALLRVVRVPRAACGIVAIPGLWFYAAATGWQASAVRATVMMTIVIAGWALRRPSDLLNSLAGAAFVILLADPQQLFQASFQLSFFVVLSLALVLPPIQRWRDQLLRHDPLLPDELRPRWQRWLDRPIQSVTNALATSVAAWLGSLPIVAAYFHLITPVSILANLVIVPLSALALACGLGSLVCGTWLPALTVIFNHSGWLWMTCMVRASEWAAGLPGAWFNVPSPGWAAFTAYYTFLAAVLSGWIFRKRRWAWTLPVLALASLGMLGIAWWRPREWTITVLPLRGGDSLYLAGPRREPTLLIDAGDESAASGVVQPVLQARGRNRLPHLVLTHGDIRHVGGIPTLARSFRIDQAWCSPVPFRSAVYRQVLEGLPPSGTMVSVVARGDRLGCLDVLHPARADAFALADDNALVFQAELEGWRILLLSDLGRRGQRQMLEREPNLRADVVIASIPAHAQPLEAPLLDVIQPRVIILSAGDFPASEMPTRKLLARLNDRGAAVFCTRDDGAVTLIARKDRCLVQATRGRQTELLRPAN
jgi:competence protein ComEC